MAAAATVIAAGTINNQFKVVVEKTAVVAVMIALVMATAARTMAMAMTTAMMTAAEEAVVVAVS